MSRAFSPGERKDHTIISDDSNVAYAVITPTHIYDSPERPFADHEDNLAGAAQEYRDRKAAYDQRSQLDLSDDDNLALFIQAEGELNVAKSRLIRAKQQADQLRAKTRVTDKAQFEAKANAILSLNREAGGDRWPR